ncbi:MAG TPA: hypothetical protein VFL04_05420 [Rectinemataceae bacterium]|nr:hypothetical protein [Rectinemataceae bacterium]
MKTLICGIALLSLVACFPLAAQDLGGPWTIRKVDFQVTGRSLAFVMMKKIDPLGTMVGSSFPDRAALESFIADRRQVLMNERVLASVETGYDSKPSSSGGYDVDLRFTTVDTWNLIALPYAKYDSNTGLLLSLRGRDYDFAGSMQELALDLNYQKDPAGRVSYTGALSFSLPFQALGRDWAFGLQEAGGLWTDGTASTVTQASLSLDLPGLGFPADITLTQGFSYNALAGAPLPANDPDSWYLSEGLALRASIPLTGSMGSLDSVELGPLNYSPGIAVSLNWNPATRLSYYGSGTVTEAGNGPYGVGDTVPAIGNGISYGRGGLVTTASNSLSLGRVDWRGNQRAGLSLMIANNTSYNAQYRDLASDLNLTAAWYGESRGRIGVAAMLTILNRFSNHPKADALANLGWYLRGVLDDRISGTKAGFVNLELPIKLFDFPTHSVIGTRTLDFELQIAPFADAAIVPSGYGSQPNADQFWYTGGREFLAFPAGLRSFIVRASAGWDLKSVIATRSLSAKTTDGSSPYEIFAGLGLKY